MKKGERKQRFERMARRKLCGRARGDQVQPRVPVAQELVIVAQTRARLGAQLNPVARRMFFKRVMNSSFAVILQRSEASSV